MRSRGASRVAVSPLPSPPLVGPWLRAVFTVTFFLHLLSQSPAWGQRWVPAGVSAHALQRVPVASRLSALRVTVVASAGSAPGLCGPAGSVPDGLCFPLATIFFMFYLFIYF